MKIAHAAAICVFCATPSALAQKSTEDDLRDWEKLAAVKFKQENPAFKKLEINRNDVE